MTLRMVDIRADLDADTPIRVEPPDAGNCDHYWLTTLGSPDTARLMLYGPRTEMVRLRDALTAALIERDES